MDHLEERIRFMDEVQDCENWSGNALALDENGQENFSFSDCICYSGITQESFLKAHYLYIFFSAAFVTKAGEKYAHWLINDSPYQDSFLTKDVEEGIRYGFSVDTSQQRHWMEASIMMLRQGFERGDKWSWSKFKEIGCSGMEAYVLACHFDVKGDKLLTTSAYKEHSPFIRGLPFSCYEGLHFDGDWHPYSLMEGYDEWEPDGIAKSMGIVKFLSRAYDCNIDLSSLNSVFKGCVEEKENTNVLGGLFTQYYIHFSKENCDRFLNHLKEKDLTCAA